MDYTNFVNIGGFQFTAGSVALLMVLAIWEMIWKGLGMWRAAQRRQTGWFIAILILNTSGILPILYLYVFSKKESTPAA